MTMAASDVLAHFEFLFDACEYLLKREGYLEAEVVATILRALMLSIGKAAKSCMSPKDVAKSREDVVHIHSATTEATSLCTCKAKLVVLPALLLVAQHIIGLGSLFKFFFCVLVAGIAVGMILDGYFAVG